jgi:hypothetical protein
MASSSLSRGGSLGEIAVGHRVEVVVGQRDELEPQAPQLHDFLDHGVVAAHAGRLAVGSPDGAERAVFRTASNGLHRRPHVPVALDQVPARLDHLVPGHASGGVLRLWRLTGAVGEHLRPDDVAVAGDDRMGGANLVRFVGEQRSVYPAVDDPRAARARRLPHLVSAQRVPRVDTDAHHVTGFHGGGVESLERLVDQDGVAIAAGRRRREHEKPARRNDGNAERRVAGIDQMNSHPTLLGN